MTKKYLYEPQEDLALDRKPLTLKLRVGILEKLKAIPEWQSSLRNLIEEFVKKESLGG